MAGNLKLKLKEVVNGERSVVFLFVCRVLVSTPLSLLFYEAAALFFLSVTALLVEIFAETNSHSIPTTLFNTSSRRPGGASSGILLGAVTLPTLMLSRLIQFSRSQHQGSEYLDVHQFWAASAACLGVLLVLAISWILPLQQSLRNTSSYFNLQPTSSKASLLTILCAAASYALTCYLSLATKSNTGSYIAINMLWLFFHGLATVLLIHHILQTFPLCASVGEALLVSSGLVLYFGDMLAHTLSKISLLFFSPKLNIVDYGNRSELSTVIQGVLLGLLLLPALYKFVLRIWWHFTILDEHTNQVDERSKIANSILFYISLFVMLTMIVPAWMYFVQDFHEHPVLWVFSFVFSEPLKRLALCIYWISVICASVLRFYNISKHSRVERILLRKYYHLLAVLMFSPALLFQPKFLDLAFGAALAVFLVLEMIRVWKIWPLGYVVHHFMNAFTDHRDSEILIVSHFSLLLGCALPKWMSSGFNDRPLTAFAGILSLGIGDTMASMVGHKYGVLRWSKTGKKTIEGTAAGITSVLAACSVLLPLLASTGYILSQHWLSLLVAVTVSGLLEAYTAQLDNAFIPLVFYSLLCL